MNRRMMVLVLGLVMGMLAVGAMPALAAQVQCDQEEQDNGFFVCNGTERNDEITGTGGDDLVRGLGEADTINGRGGRERHPRGRQR